ncbi:glycosyltransferase family protein [Hymenobacter rubidus]|uniref:hypothetical protein n=1 Tax=Hymenobacter rubidus TaxID=1441626 RepID=UPI00191E13AC|nr:hypothetical protein [Hymenobacter rubidus]
MKNGLRLLLLLAFYGPWFGVFTWPLAATFSAAFPVVPGSDSYVFIWNVWHFREAVLSGHNPYVTDWLFYPRHTGLLLHSYAPIMGLLSLVLGNAMLAINVVLLLSYALSGAGAYLLARRWVASPVLCLLAGFIFAYSPYKLQRLPEHYTLVLTATVPFYVLLFLRAFTFREGPRMPLVRSWRAVVGCLVLGIFTLFCDYYVLFGLLYFSLFYALWFWFRMGQVRWRGHRAWLALAVILLGSSLFIRKLRLLRFDENSGLWWGGDVASYFVPPPTSRLLYGPWAAKLTHDPAVFLSPGSIENTLFIGFALPLLAMVLWALRLFRWRPVSQRFADEQGRPLAWVLVGFLVLTVPTLRIHGYEELNMPTAVLHFVPFFNNIRCPTRWVMMIGLLLPIVTLSALEAAWRGRLRVSIQLAMSVLLAAVVLAEYWPQPYVLASAATIPPVFREVARLPGTTLIPIPLGIIDGFRQVGRMESEQMFYQTLHHKKLPIGYLSRLPPAYFASLDQQPVLHALLSVQTRPDSVQPAPPTAEQMEAFFRVYKPAAFVISPAYCKQPVHAYLRQLLLPYGYQERMVGDYALLVPPAQ